MRHQVVDNVSPIENAVERQAEEVLGQKDLVDLALPRLPGVLVAANARQKGGGGPEARGVLNAAAVISRLIDEAREDEYRVISVNHILWTTVSSLVQRCHAILFRNYVRNNKSRT